LKKPATRPVEPAPHHFEPSEDDYSHLGAQAAEEVAPSDDADDYSDLESQFAEEPELDYNTWSVTELRKECKSRVLPSSGKKSVLIERLNEDDVESGFRGPSDIVPPEPEPAAPSPTSYLEMSGAELKDECKRRGLASSGTKSKLVERLTNHDDGVTVSRRPRSSAEVPANPSRMVGRTTTVRHGVTDRLRAGEYYRAHTSPNCSDCPDPVGDRCDIRRNGELACLVTDRNGRASWRHEPTNGREVPGCGSLPWTSRCQLDEFS
jgi:hypothetical protein